MIFSASLTDDNDITVTLSVSAGRHALELATGVSECESGAGHPADSFFSSLPEMTLALRQAHSSVFESLLRSSSDILVHALQKREGE